MVTAKARERLPGEAFRPFTSAYDPEFSRGITDDDFLANKNQVQDWAFDRYLSDMEGYNHDNLEKVGNTNRRGIAGAPIPITTAGIMAAAHRAGQQWRAYLDWAQANGWQTQGMAFPLGVPFLRNASTGEAHSADAIRTNFERVETRMRLFEDSPYWRADRAR